ncbi:MAG: type II toxin-antitoxin system HicA family toxin [Verrucomicrobiota bacterium]
MGKHDKVREKILSARSDQQISFRDLVGLLKHLGFEERVKGSHHIFVRAGVAERINLQADGSNAKAYQVRQVRQILCQYLDL